jgi:O-methyltransferase involved in polyketide biosynthesis
MESERDYSSISPSAKSLLLVKAQTELPYARTAAEMLFGVEAVRAAERETAASAGAGLRVRHFEARARSLDRALSELGARNVIEIAAGLSFRGLAMAGREGVFYVDTDLPAIADMKADLAARLQPGALAGTLRIRALDALDASALRDAVGEMPAGAIYVVQEGLLMYLDESEKARLAAGVREVLRERGGAWATADIYVKSEVPKYREERMKTFVMRHRIDENKFDDWGAAEAFFVGCGFVVRRREPVTDDPWRVRETWVLEVG